MINQSIMYFKRYSKIVASLLLLGISFFLISDVFAAQTLGSVAAQVQGSLNKLTKLITGGSYIAGIGFSIGAILKFKQHKDNPTQIPVGTPIALIFIAAALLFLPTILGVTGATLFGSKATTGGPSGVIFKVK